MQGALGALGSELGLGSSLYLEGSALSWLAAWGLIPTDSKHTPYAPSSPTHAKQIIDTTAPAVILFSRQ